MRFYGSLWRRIAKHDANDSTWFIWDGLQLLQETRNHALVTYVYAPDSDEALARIEDTINDAHWRPEEQRHNQIFYFHPHINGAPEEMTSSGGQVAWQARYKVWGALLQETDGPYRTPSPEGKDYHPLPQNLRFQGQYFDRETGLHYNTFRYYDPDVGRFTTEDPIGLNGGLNLYQYAPNPFAWIDPWGLIKAPASLPDTPGVYILTNGDDRYVGSAGGGKGGMNTRVSTNKHSSAQELLKRKGTTLEYRDVDLGSARTRRERERILRNFEQKEIDERGGGKNNKRRAEAKNKNARNEAVVKKHGAKRGPLKNCKLEKKK